MRLIYEMPVKETVCHTGRLSKRTFISGAIGFCRLPLIYKVASTKGFKSRDIQQGDAFAQWVN